MKSKLPLTAAFIAENSVAHDELWVHFAERLERKIIALEASNRGHAGRVERDVVEKTKLVNRIVRLCDALKDLLAVHPVPVAEDGFPSPSPAMIEADAVLRREAKLGPWRVER